MATVSIEEAQANLPKLIDGLAPGEELVILRNDHPVAKLIAETRERRPRVPGNCKGLLTIISEDDDHLKDFEEYMP